MPSSDSLYTLLAAAARRRPDHVAIDYLGTHMTYAELDRQASLVARFLTARGVGPGQRIGFCFRKCPEALVCLFGIIRTGATYVPFDPQLPPTRINALLHHCDIRCMVADASIAGIEGLDWRVVARPAGEPAAADIVPLADILASASTADSPVLAPADDITSILYTSGSTGEPKGVMITTKSLLHFAQWGVDTFDITSTDRISNHAPYSFDLSTFDIFAAVRAGATMCPVPETAHSYPSRLARFIAQERITLWYSVPWSLVLMGMRGSLHTLDLSHLRHVLFAGEVMPPEHLRVLMKLIPNATWWNLYGPTETNVCTYHKVEPADLDRPEGVPIGRPITNTRSWIVDLNGLPVPAGEPGELVISGPTLFRGYFNNPKGTREVFLSAPDGSRAYRTGDNVIDRGDGVLLFLGRCDRMVKVRGYRIELAEVEKVVAEHPAVAEVAVLAVRDSILSNTLAGFVSLRDGHEVTGGELAAYCRRHLPYYMIPTKWRFLDRLPRNPHGKIDLTRLARQAEGR